MKVSVSILASLLVLAQVQATDLSFIQGRVVMFKGIGSGLLVAAPKSTYIVTAAHVAAQVNTNTILIVRGPGEIPRQFPVGWLVETIKLPDKQTGLFKFHPSADCAAMPFAFGNKITQRLSTNLSHTAQFAYDGILDSTNGPKQLTPVMLVGFPWGLGDQTDFAPFVTPTTVASRVMTNEVGVKFFFLNNPGIDGYSGCPIFEQSATMTVNGAELITETTLRFWGVLSRTDPDRSGGEMARIIHADHVAELIKDVEASLPELPPKPK